MVPWVVLLCVTVVYPDHIPLPFSIFINTKGRSNVFSVDAIISEPQR